MVQPQSINSHRTPSWITRTSVGTFCAFARLGFSRNKLDLAHGNEF
jgi:hypothetical protein